MTDFTAPPTNVTYKPSGIDWLGDIPIHWEVRRFRNVFDYISRGDTPSYADSGRIKVINQACIQQLALNLDNVKYNIEADISDYKGYVRKGDVLINSTGTGTLGRIGYFDRENEGEFFVDSHVTILRSSSSDIYPKFYYYFLANKQELITALASEGATNQIELQREKLRNLSVPVPPIEEQKAIVAKIESQLLSIESFLAQKQRFIDLLREQKQAIINEAVTKGLYAQEKRDSLATQGNPSFPDSAPWLADVPEHWEIRRLKSVAEIFRGKFTHRPRNDERLYGGQYPFIQTGEISQAEKYVSSYTQTLNDWGRSVSEEFPVGTLCMTIAANIADVAILNMKACFPDSIVGFKPCKKVDLNFLYYYLKSIRHYFFRIATINTQYNLNVERISSVLIPVPPLTEQVEIVDHIEREAGRIDTLVRKTEREMSLMQEYRQSMIAEAVTGKMAVHVPA